MLIQGRKAWNFNSKLWRFITSGTTDFWKLKASFSEGWRVQWTLNMNIFSIGPVLGSAYLCKDKEYTFYEHVYIYQVTSLKMASQTLFTLWVIFRIYEPEKDEGNRPMMTLKVINDFFFRNCGSNSLWSCRCQVNTIKCLS